MMSGGWLCGIEEGGSTLNMSTFQPKDRDLFFEIAKDIKRYPDKYRSAGEWLNQYYDGYDESYWIKRKDELAHYIARRQLDNKLKYINDKIELALRHSPEPIIAFRLALALQDLMEEYEGGGVMDAKCVRALLIISWLATDPEADKTNLNLTKFASIPWKTKNLMSKGYSVLEPTRFGLAPFLFMVLDLTLHHDYGKYGEPLYELNLAYLPAIRTAWAKLKAEKDLKSEKPAETEQDTTHTIRWRIWTCVKRIPRWIYVLVIFLAALLTCIYLTWWFCTNFLSE